MDSAFPVQNQEHIEATQDCLNKQVGDFRSFLSEADNKKFEAVTQCFQILKENKVAAFIFPILPAPGFQNGCYQYNNMLDFLVFDEAGRLTEESKNKTKTFNTLFIGAAFRFVEDMLRSKGNLNGYEAFPWGVFCGFFQSVIRDTDSAMNDKEFYK